ncbi:SDR family oxidoreductase [Nitratireductor aquimarinus]|uniref:SDR family NAD(P)-dependent oxidoreductase n=1 Tax=Nitratireductor TaxID=245876 RepID=UPI0019D38841|nr:MULTISPECIES: SDR family oxidoreductase [Nitratireductor]MBN7778010.1 SDR family oxidoreductase [Nitratireductor pacificus]MBN7782332.1 SDR family oxidoreductase [Nitratireductor pacificus]MBN7791139.1 SDR family oxidoreductase [Nitratireductor aquimarinus]MBY6100219.1 SDR family oxidoreductase [Nitratireductor aquimarinus]
MKPDKKTSFADLDGKFAVVTGGTRGIGAIVVERMLEAGASVLFTGTDADRGRQAQERMGGTFLRADAAAPDHADHIAKAVRERFERLDILVNNAGSLGSPQGVEDTTPEALDQTLAIHLRAPWLTMSALAPLMRPAGGSIVNMASIAGHRVGASSVAYSVSKAALQHLTRCAAAEFGKDGIRVNSISPGFVSTDIHAAAIPGSEARGARFVQGLGKVFVSRQALPHLGQPGDIAEIVLFLASDASAFVTGSDIVADGGVIWGRDSLG